MSITIDKVIEQYIATRDKKEATEKRHKEELAPFKEQMKLMEAWLQSQLLSQGLQNFRAKTGGIAFLSESTSVTVADWPSVLGFIQTHEAWDLLEQRISKTAYLDYQSNGEAPQGVNVATTLNVRVQRG
jgi:hypothetical protein